MSNPRPRETAYYASHSLMSDPGELKNLLEAIPRHVAGVVAVVSGLVRSAHRGVNALG